MKTTMNVFKSKFAFGDKVQHVISPNAKGIVTEIAFKGGNNTPQCFVEWNNGTMDWRSEVALEHINEKSSIGFEKKK